MEWSIQEVARLAGVTSRTLRHYGDLGLLPPSRVGFNGYRYYDEAAIARLQRVLLLRELGVGLTEIGKIVERQGDEAAALTIHLDLLRQEKDRLDRQIRAVEHTIKGLLGQDTLMAQSMLEGFDHTQYQEEVEERWGKNTYARSDRWWRTLSDEERTQWQEISVQLGKDWTSAAQDPGVSPDSPAATDLAQRHIAWLASIPGTPAADPRGDLEEYVRALADMYVMDERFAANYGGVEGAQFVRDTLVAWLDAQSPSN